MSVAAKTPSIKAADRPMPSYVGKRRRSWNRWNKQAALVVFIVGLVALWLAVSLLFVLEIQ